MSIRSFAATAIIAASSIATTAHAQALTDSFTYQGTLNDNGAPANGLYDISFFIYDAEVGGSVPRDGFTTVFNVEVVDGLFTTEVDFGVSGQIFDTDQSQWLELRVSPAGQPGTTILTPRTKLVPATNANYALRSGTTLDDAYTNGASMTITNDSGPLSLFGSANQLASLELYGFDGNLRALIQHDGFDGGAFSVLSPSENFVANLRTDNSSGGGGYLFLARNDSSDIGVILEGNAAGNEGGALRLSSPSQTININSTLSEDLSVALPVNAINATEILNETGAAETTTSVGINLTNDAAVIDIVNSVTINAPTAGFVLVLASAEVTVNHVNTQNSSIVLGVSDSSTAFNSNTDIEIRIDPDVLSGGFDYPFTSHAIYPVSAGANTFYFLGSDTMTGGASASVRDRQLSAVFIPTSYGSIAREPGQNLPDMTMPISRPLNAYDILAEQNAALHAETERQQRELDEMRAMMEQIKSEMQREQRQQSRD